MYIVYRELSWRRWISSVRLWGPPSQFTRGCTRIGVHNVRCVQGVELEKVEFFCEALGSPQPTYTWLDKDGLDATQKLGKSKEPLLVRPTSIIVFKVDCSKMLVFCPFSDQ
jgi:hypothetical protein